jgi:hypothetical protein
MGGFVRFGSGGWVADALNKLQNPAAFRRRAATSGLPEPAHAAADSLPFWAALLKARSFEELNF